MTRRILLCADDYGLAPGIGTAIRALIAARRLNATSVMTLFPDIAEEAGRLVATTRGTGARIGLHVTLTGGFAPLKATPLGGDALPSMGRLLSAAFLGRIARDAVAQEVEAQFAAFRAAFGRPPDHVDGHQHAHLLPGIRAVVLDATARHAPGALVRDCTQAPGARLGFDAKGRFISALSSRLADQARARGLVVNSGFAGAYALAPGADFAALLARFLAGLPEGGLAMVHPGHVDDVLKGRDRVWEARAAEYAVLSGPGFPRLLATAGVRL